MKLGDFGLAFNYYEERLTREQFYGTPLYSSPEQLQNGHISFSSDIFSLGVIIFEMLISPLQSQNQKVQLIENLKATGAIPSWLDSNSSFKLQFLIQLIKNLTKVEPRQRLSSSSILTAFKDNIMKEQIITDRGSYSKILKIIFNDCHKYHTKPKFCQNSHFDKNRFKQFNRFFEKLGFQGHQVAQVTNKRSDHSQKLLSEGGELFYYDRDPLLAFTKLSIGFKVEFVYGYFNKLTPLTFCCFLIKDHPARYVEYSLIIFQLVDPNFSIFFQY